MKTRTFFLVLLLAFFCFSCKKEAEDNTLLILQTRTWYQSAYYSEKGQMIWNFGEDNILYWRTQTGKNVKTQGQTTYKRSGSQLIIQDPHHPKFNIFFKLVNLSGTGVYIDGDYNAYFEYVPNSRFKMDAY